MVRRPRRLRRYEYIERRDSIGEQAYSAVHLLEEISRDHEYSTLFHSSREELLVRLGEMRANVKRAREIVDRLCWRRVEARRSHRLGARQEE